MARERHRLLCRKSKWSHVVAAKAINHICTLHLLRRAEERYLYRCTKYYCLNIIIFITTIAIQKRRVTMVEFLSSNQINLSLPYRSFISNVLGELNWIFESHLEHTKNPIVVHLDVFYFIIVHYYTLNCCINLCDVYSNWAAFELLDACIILDYIWFEGMQTQNVRAERHSYRNAWPDYCIRFGQLVLMFFTHDSEQYWCSRQLTDFMTKTFNKTYSNWNSVWIVFSIWSTFDWNLVFAFVNRISFLWILWSWIGFLLPMMMIMIKLVYHRYVTY